MRRSATTTIALFVFLALMLAACDNEAEEDLPRADSEELSAEDAYHEIVVAAVSLTSFQVETVYEQEGAPERRETAIFTEAGQYTHSEDPSYDDVCEMEDEWIVSPPDFCLYDMNQTLWLGEEIYQRNRETGEWAKLSGEGWFGFSLISDRIEFNGADSPGMRLTQEEYGRVLSLLGYNPGSLTDTELGDEETFDGRRLRSLSLHFSDDYPEEAMPDFSEFPLTDLAPEDREEIEAEFANFPTVVEGEVVLWFDERYLIRRSDMTLRSLQDGRVVHEEHRSSVISLHNEAQLPGPLPE